MLESCNPIIHCITSCLCCFCKLCFHLVLPWMLHLPHMDAHDTRHHVQLFRMRPNNGASGSQGTPVRRSARQAGEDPEPPQPPPPPPSQEPSPSQFMMMMDERHNQHLTQIMREFGTYMQARNVPPPGRSKLQDFQRSKITDS